MARIDAELWKAPVAGLNLVPGTLGDQLGEERALLLFLRHLG